MILGEIKISAWSWKEVGQIESQRLEDAIDVAEQYYKETVPANGVAGQNNGLVGNENLLFPEDAVGDEGLESASQQTVPWKLPEDIKNLLNGVAFTDYDGKRYHISIPRSPMGLVVDLVRDSDQRVFRSVTNIHLAGSAFKIRKIFLPKDMRGKGVGEGLYRVCLSIFPDGTIFQEEVNDVSTKRRLAEHCFLGPRKELRYKSDLKAGNSGLRVVDGQAKNADEISIHEVLASTLLGEFFIRISLTSLTAIIQDNLSRKALYGVAALRSALNSKRTKTDPITGKEFSVVGDFGIRGVKITAFDDERNRESGELKRAIQAWIAEGGSQSKEDIIADPAMNVTEEQMKNILNKFAIDIGFNNKPLPQVQDGMRKILNGELLSSPQEVVFHKVSQVRQRYAQFTYSVIKPVIRRSLQGEFRDFNESGYREIFGGKFEGSDYEFIFNDEIWFIVERAESKSIWFIRMPNPHARNIQKEMAAKDMPSAAMPGEEGKASPKYEAMNAVETDKAWLMRFPTKESKTKEIERIIVEDLWPLLLKVNGVSNDSVYYFELMHTFINILDNGWGLSHYLMRSSPLEIEKSWRNLQEYFESISLQRNILRDEKSAREYLGDYPNVVEEVLSKIKKLPADMVEQTIANESWDRQEVGSLIPAEDLQKSLEQLEPILQGLDRAYPKLALLMNAIGNDNGIPQEKLFPVTDEDRRRAAEAEAVLVQGESGIKFDKTKGGSLDKTADGAMTGVDWKSQYVEDIGRIYDIYNTLAIKYGNTLRFSKDKIIRSSRLLSRFQTNLITAGLTLGGVVSVFYFFDRPIEFNIPNLLTHAITVAVGGYSFLLGMVFQNGAFAVNKPIKRLVLTKADTLRRSEMITDISHEMAHVLKMPSDNLYANAYSYLISKKSGYNSIANSDPGFDVYDYGISIANIISEIFPGSLSDQEVVLRKFLSDQEVELTMYLSSFKLNEDKSTWKDKLIQIKTLVKDNDYVITTLNETAWARYYGYGIAQLALLHYKNTDQALDYIYRLGQKKDARLAENSELETGGSLRDGAMSAIREVTVQFYSHYKFSSCVIIILDDLLKIKSLKLMYEPLDDNGRPWRAEKSIANVDADNYKTNVFVPGKRIRIQAKSEEIPENILNMIADHVAGIFSDYRDSGIGSEEDAVWGRLWADFIRREALFESRKEIAALIRLPDRAMSTEEMKQEIQVVEAIGEGRIDPGHHALIKEYIDGYFKNYQRVRGLIDAYAHANDLEIKSSPGDAAKLPGGSLEDGAMKVEGLRQGPYGLLTNQQYEERVKAAIERGLTYDEVKLKKEKTNAIDSAMNGSVEPYNLKKGGIDLNPAQMSMQVKNGSPIKAFACPQASVGGDDNGFKFDFNGTEIDAAQVIGATLPSAP